jgi:iron complex transport system substrate-binding protein
MKKHLLQVIAIIFCISLILPACARKTPEPAQGIKITDMAGRDVTVPVKAQSICVLDAYAAPVAVMLGYGEKMPSAINAVSRNLLLQSICPALKAAVVVKTGGAINAEMILKLKTDLIIVGDETYSSAEDKAKLDTLGIPYIVVRYSSMTDQMEVVTLLGEALQNEDMALQYVGNYQKCIDLMKEGIPEIPENQMIRLYHSVNEAARTDYPGSLCADWISLMNVNNVSLYTKLSMTEDKAYATLEQIYSWDPDIIIANESGVADYILTDSKWQGLRAVINKNVWQIPIGLSRWGHPTSIETPLAILWLAELLYPERFDIDIRSEMITFYKTFYNYTLSDQEAEDIISGYGVRMPKTASAD